MIWEMHSTKHYMIVLAASSVNIMHQSGVRLSICPSVRLCILCVPSGTQVKSRGHKMLLAAET